jgi:hypothetical protein
LNLVDQIEAANGADRNLRTDLATLCETLAARADNAEETAKHFTAISSEDDPVRFDCARYGGGAMEARRVRDEIQRILNGEYLG